MHLQHIPEAISNTVKMAERCSVELVGFAETAGFDVPGGKTDAEYLHELGRWIAQAICGETDDIREV